MLVAAGLDSVFAGVVDVDDDEVSAEVAGTVDDEPARLSVR